MMLAKEINNTLRPYRERRTQIVEKPQYITDVLAHGADQARVIARETLDEVKQKMGLI
jgi:tryptophanyl-tRNA synthetase